MEHNTLRMFEPVQYSFLSVQVYNTACTRSRPWNFSIQDNICSLDVTFLTVPFQSVYTVVVHCGEGEWNIRFGKFPPLTALPVFQGKPEILCVPEEVKLAIFELLISPFLKQFESIIGAPVEIVTSTLYPDNEDIAECSIPFTLYVEEYKDNIPLMISIKKKKDALTLLEKLKELPLGYHHHNVDSIPISVGVEVGYTKLKRVQLDGLEKDDILIPDYYSLQEDKVQLRYSETLVDCEFRGGIATVMDVKNTASSDGQESSNELEQNPSGEAHQQAETSRQPVKSGGETVKQQGQVTSEVDVSSLELPVVFELERRVITVHELGSLAPGYTFALSVDTQAPVTLRVNGKAIGVGRIVELNGSLGVQIVQLIDSTMS